MELEPVVAFKCCLKTFLLSRLLISSTRRAANLWLRPYDTVVRYDTRV